MSEAHSVSSLSLPMSFASVRYVNVDVTVGMLQFIVTEHI